MEFDISTLEKAVNDFRGQRDLAFAEEVCCSSRICTVVFMDECLWRNAVPADDKAKFERLLAEAGRLLRDELTVGSSDHEDQCKLQLFSEAVEDRLSTIQNLSVPSAVCLNERD